MSSRSPRNRVALLAAAGALAVAFALSLGALAAPAPSSTAPTPAPSATAPATPAPAHPGPPARRRMETNPDATLPPDVAAAYDDSTAEAHRLLLLLRPLYGGIDNWAHLGGVRYYVTYRIPGPDSTTAKEWTESHFVWTHDRPRMRIDNADDSTIVVVTGDSTYVRRGGEWTLDPLVVVPAREQALDEVWLTRVPWNLLDSRLKRRLNRPWVENGPLDVRIEYGPGLDRPAGTRLFVRFDPPSYALRSMRWYDPRARKWYLMEFSDDGRRYGWTWSGRRVLRATDESGAPGPVLLTEVIQDMQLETFLPAEVLAPPGGKAYVSRPDSTAASAPAAAAPSAAPGAPGR